MKRADARTTGPEGGTRLSNEGVGAATRCCSREGTRKTTRSPARTRRRVVETAGSARLTRRPDKWIQEDSANESADLSRRARFLGRPSVSTHREIGEQELWPTEIRERFVSGGTDGKYRYAAGLGTMLRIVAGLGGDECLLIERGNEGVVCCGIKWITARFVDSFPRYFVASLVYFCFLVVFAFKCL